VTERRLIAANSAISFRRYLQPYSPCVIAFCGPVWQDRSRSGRARAAAAGKPLAKLPLDELRAASGRVGSDVYKHLGAANVVKRYAPDGAAGPKQLRKQLAFWLKKLA